MRHEINLNKRDAISNGGGVRSAKRWHKPDIIHDDIDRKCINKLF